MLKIKRILAINVLMAIVTMMLPSVYAEQLVLQSTATILEPGNAYKWYADKKEATTYLKNVTNEAITADIEYKLVNEETDEILWTYNESRTINANTTIRTINDFGSVKKCGIYRLDVDIETDSGNVLATQTPAKIAIVKTDKSGIKNEDVAYAAQFQRYTQDSITEGVKVLAMANVYGVRQDLSWTDIEKNGTFDINNSPSKFAIDKIIENNMKPIGMLWHPPIDDGDFEYLEIPGARTGEAGERQIQRWSDYVSYVGTQMRNKIDYYEVWNEPNIQEFNSDLVNGNGNAYAKALIAAAQAMKNVNPDAVVAGPAITGISKEGIFYDTVNTNKVNEIGGKTFFDQAMDEGIWEDISAISFHPYIWESTPETEIQGINDGLNYFKQEYAKKGALAPKLWSTEAGRYTEENAVKTDKNKGALMCRQFLAMKNRGLLDAPFVMFSFEQSDGSARSYGHVSEGVEGYEKNGTLYFPNEAFLSVAGMNYVMANSEFVQNIDNDNPNVHISKYWSDKFNKNIITLYTTGSNTNVSLNIGENRVTLFDEYGNSEILNSSNGEFQIEADGNLSYIVVGEVLDDSQEQNSTHNNMTQPMELRQSEIINVFNSLQGYSKTAGVRVAQEALPDGMGILGQPWMGEKFQSIDNPDGSTSAGFINDGGTIYVPFSEVIAEGKIHYSMDMKFIQSEDEQAYLTMDYIIKNSGGDWNPQNIWGVNQNPLPSFIFRINNTSDSAREGVIFTSQDIEGEWHSIDFYIDIDKKSVKFYLDGTQIKNETMIGEGIKALRLTVNTPSGKFPTVYFDNIYIRHFKSDSSDVVDGYESIKMSSDFPAKGVSLKNGIVRLVYSEPIAVSDGGYEPWSDDITITRLSDGTVLEADVDYTFEFSQRDGGVIRFLTDLEEGEYEIAQTYIDVDSYGGLISGRTVLKGESTHFYTEKSNIDIDLADERRYLIDEDFNDYNGGTPAHSVEMINGWGVTTGAVSSTHTNAQDKAIKLSLDDKAAVFRFNKPIQGGKFVVEFDVKHTNGGWGVNLLKERDFLPANYLGKTHWEIRKDEKGNPLVGNKGWLTAQNDYYQEELAKAKALDSSLDETSWRNANWPALWDAYRTDPENVLSMRDVDIKTSFLIGNHSDDTGIRYSNARGNTGYQDNAATGRSATKNDWTHVKVEVDTTSGAYIITAGDSEPFVAKTNLSNFSTGNYRYTNGGNSFAGSYNIETRRQNWTFGFGGIALRTFASDTENAAVEFDNLKVYIENSYNDYETFDKISGQESARLQGWYNILGEGPTSDPAAGEYRTGGNYYYASEGKDYNAETNPTDKALAYVVSSSGSGVIAHQLSVPVKAGKSFEMEFDLKIDNTGFDGTKVGDGKDTAFAFQMMTTGRLYNPQYVDGFTVLNKTNIDNDSNNNTEIEPHTGDSSSYDPDWSRTYNANLLLSNSAIADGGTLEDAGKFRFYTGRENREPSASNGTVAYKDGDENTNLSLNPKEWNHIKISGRENGAFYAVTLSVNGITSQEYTTNIPSNQDIVAVAFAPLRSTSNRRAIHLDNFKVSEPGCSKNSVINVNKITGMNKTDDLTDSFKVSDDSINVKFAIPNLTENDLKYITIINETDGSEVDVAKTISADKRSVNIKFNTLPDIGDEVELHVNQIYGIVGNDSYLNGIPKIQEYSKTFTVSSGNDSFEVEDIRLFRYYPEWVHPEYSDVISPEGWHPVLTKELSDLSSVDDQFKIVVRGYNGTNTTKAVKFINAEYLNGMLKSLGITDGNIGSGQFEIESEPVQLDNESEMFKAFVFEKDLITPIGKHIYYDLTFSE